VKMFQGDQIGRIFAFWVVAKLWRFFEINKSNHYIFGYSFPRLRWCISLDKKWVGLHILRFFLQTHPVTLVLRRFCVQLSYGRGFKRCLFAVTRNPRTYISS
jgi:hypothetical protein